MKRTIGQSVVIASIFALLGSVTSVHADGVRWAGEVNGPWKKARLHGASL